jgi:protein involved in sex pheromone biosynthesis
MKKLLIICYSALLFIVSSCHNKANTTQPATGSPDSAANNGVVPPSAAPGNATNSSLADTTYKSKDSVKGK